MIQALSIDFLFFVACVIKLQGPLFYLEAHNFPRLDFFLSNKAFFSESVKGVVLYAKE